MNIYQLTTDVIDELKVRHSEDSNIITKLEQHLVEAEEAGHWVYVWENTKASVTMYASNVTCVKIHDCYALCWVEKNFNYLEEEIIEALSSAHNFSTSSYVCAVRTM